MQGLIDILKSKGKLGGVALMLMGIGMVIYSYFKGIAQYQEGMAVFFLGLGVLGIRSKQG